MPLTTLPQELILQILSYVDIEELCAIDAVNKAFNKLTENCWKSSFLRLFVIDNTKNTSSSANIIPTHEFEAWKKQLIRTISVLCSNLETRRLQTITQKHILNEAPAEHLPSCLKDIDPTKSWKSLLVFVIKAIRFSTTCDWYAKPAIWDHLAAFQYPSSSQFNWDNPKCLFHLGSLLHWLLNFGIMPPTFVGLIGLTSDISITFRRAFLVPMDFGDLDVFNAFW